MARAVRRKQRLGWGAFVVVWLVGGLVALESAAANPPEEIRRLEEEGDAGAQYRMAQIQLRSEKHKTAAAMTADPESREGLRWRAQKGNRAAQRKLGWSLLGVPYTSLHLVGAKMATTGSEAEVAEGLKWLAEAAQRGDAEAARMSAWYYQKRDEAKAFYWWNRAADLGSSEAQWKMVERCRSGLGTRPNETEAFRWCRKLAEGGDVRAMKEVAAAYESGRGCTKDYGEAKRWYERAGDGAGVQRMERMLREKPGGGGPGFHVKTPDVRIRGPGSLPRHVR